MKKVIIAISSLILVAVLAFFLINNLQKSTIDANSLSIVTTNFIGYDLARAITNNTDSSITMLVPPGSDIHSYEPTPGDIVKLKKANLIIYNGGESDEWLKDLLKDNEISSDKTFRMMDTVKLKEEEVIEGMEDEDDSKDHEDQNHHHKDDEEAEYDEHIWTSIPNTIKILTSLNTKLSEINPKDAKRYSENTANYTAKLQDIDSQLLDIINSSTRKELIFADRFPFRYFTDEYNLKYYAAFPGCSEQSEASSQTIAYLIDKVKSDNIPVIFKIELTSDNLAKTISEATGAKILTLNAGHNISTTDFQNGTTYLDLLTANLNTLKEALN